MTQSDMARYAGITRSVRIAAVDGGGTKTAFVLCDGDGYIVKQLTRGASNPFDLGFDAAFDLLREGLDELLAGEGGLGAPLAGFFAGLSGGATGGSDTRLRDFFRELLPNAKTDASSDMINAISSGILSGEGCALISGTGSAAFARVGGRLYRAGGWGYLFDGAGGGYDLGRGAVAEALRAQDGRCAAGEMTRLLEEALGGPPADRLLEFYEKGKRYIASFAPLVFEAARRGDPAALALLRQTAGHLAEILGAVCRAAGLREPEVVLIGGLFREPELLLPPLRASLAISCRFLFPEAPPVFGAAAEAARLAGLPVDEAFRTAFLQDLKQI